MTRYKHIRIIIICSYFSDASQFTFLMSLAAAPPSPLAICPEPDLPPDLLLPISSSGIMLCMKSFH